MFWRRSKLWVFLGKKDFFFRTNTWEFSKTLNSDTFLQNAFQNLLLLMQSPIVQKLRFSKKWRFLRKNLWKISEALFGIFYQECVSDFHIASEFSKQSNFWVFWRNRCCFWEDPFFFPKAVNVAFSSRLRFKKYNCSRELKTFNSLRFPGK